MHWVAKSFCSFVHDQFSYSFTKATKLNIHFILSYIAKIPLTDFTNRHLHLANENQSPRPAEKILISPFLPHFETSTFRILIYVHILVSKIGMARPPKGLPTVAKSEHRQTKIGKSIRQNFKQKDVGLHLAFSNLIQSKQIFIIIYIIMPQMVR